MAEEKVENAINDIDRIDVIHDDVFVTISEKTDSGESYEYDAIQVSTGKGLGAGNILGQVFNLISQIREKEYWKLNDTEVNSLNNTCPKIIPKFISQNSGIIGCVLSILGIIVKRIKLDHEDTLNHKKPELDSNIDLPVEEINSVKSGDQSKSLTGSRGG